VSKTPKSSFVFYQKYKKQFDKLSDEEAGQLIKALFAYNEDNKLVLRGKLEGYFEIIKDDIDSCYESYQETCSKNRNNINKRWAEYRKNNNSTKDTTVYHRIPLNYDSDNDNDNDNNNKITKEDQKDWKKIQQDKISKELQHIQKEEFEKFWISYIVVNTPRGSKSEALKSFLKQRNKFSFEKIAKGLRAYLSECNDTTYTKSVSAFLNQEVFNDYDVTAIDVADKKANQTLDKRQKWIKKLLTINNLDPFFSQFKNQLAFMGKWHDKLDFCFIQNDKVYFLTDSKFNRDWIKTEFKSKLENLFPQKKKMVIYSQEEFG